LLLQIFTCRCKDVDARVKPGHDEWIVFAHPPIQRIPRIIPLGQWPIWQTKAENNRSFTID
jgi:hypothetical protein